MADFVVRKLGTDEEIHRFPNTHQPPTWKHIERVEMGWARNADLDHFYLDTSEVEAELISSMVSEAKPEL